MSTMNDFLDFWDSISGTALKVAKYQNAKSEADANRDNAIKIEKQRMEHSRVQGDLQFQQQLATDVERDNEAKLKDSINELELWNVNAESIIGMDEKYQSDDAKKLMEKMGIELKSDLTIGYNTQGTTRELIKRMNFANKMQTEVIGNIDEVLGEIHGSQKHLDNVGTKEGIDLVSDLDDYQEYIKTNPLKPDGTPLFPEDNPLTKLDEGYLRTAFTSDKMLDMKIDAKYKAVLLRNHLKSMEDDPNNKAQNKAAAKMKLNLAKELKQNNATNFNGHLQTLQIIENSKFFKDNISEHKDGPQLKSVGGLQMTDDAWTSTPHVQSEVTLDLAFNIVEQFRNANKGTQGGNMLEKTFPYLNGLISDENLRDEELLHTAHIISQMYRPGQVPVHQAYNKDGEKIEVDYATEAKDIELTEKGGKKIFSTIDVPDDFAGYAWEKEVYDKPMYSKEGSPLVIWTNKSGAEEIRSQKWINENLTTDEVASWKPYTKEASRIKYHKPTAEINKWGLLNSDLTHRSTGYPVYRYADVYKEGIGGVLFEPGREPESYHDPSMTYKGEPTWYYPSATPDPMSKHTDPRYLNIGATQVGVTGIDALKLDWDPKNYWSLKDSPTRFVESLYMQKTHGTKEILGQDVVFKQEDEKIKNKSLEYLSESIKAFQTMMDMAPHLKFTVMEQQYDIQSLTGDFKNININPYTILDEGLTIEDILANPGIVDKLDPVLWKQMLDKKIESEKQK